MTLKKLLVANRGEIAVRIMRAAFELGIPTVALHSEDDAQSLHVRTADEAHALKGTGVDAYLDIDQVLEAARLSESDAIHPGYGFLAENAQFAAACAEAGVTFVGPTASVLELLGDKISARALAHELGIPLLPASSESVTIEGAHAFFEGLSDGEAMLIKAVAGGGGRGMRVVEQADEIDAAFKRCQSEAKASFGNEAVYVETLMRRARHVEIQILGDGQGGISHLGERECSIQRRHQKLIEIAPAPALNDSLRQAISTAAVKMATAVGYQSLGTFEFLVDTAKPDSFVFMEANPRLQVEHTVTEQVTGVDLVKAQLRIAGGQDLAEVGLEQASVPKPRGTPSRLASTPSECSRTVRFVPPAEH